MSYPLGTVTQNASNYTEVITAGSGTWTSPTVATNGFTVILSSIEVIAGGAKSATAGAVDAKGVSGAGGGAYAKSAASLSGSPATGNWTATVAPTQVTANSAGADTWFSSTGSAPTTAAQGALAKGGGPGVANGGSAGPGGPTAGSIGDTTFRGGNGGVGAAVSGGGGGGAAGPGGAGGDAVGNAAGGGQLPGGGGGATNGNPGVPYGGGGGGSNGVSAASGNGAQGYIRLTYSKQFANTITETVTTQDDGTNLLTGDDSDFEAGIGAWASTGGTVTSSTDVANTGTHSLKMVRLSPGGAWNVFSGGVVVTAGTNYVAYAFMRSAVTQRNMWMKIFWYSDSGATVNIDITDGTLFLVLSSTSAWKKLFIAGIAPVGAIRARVVVLGGNAATNEVHYVDTVSLQTSPVSRLFVGARSIADSITAPTHSVARIYGANRNVSETITAPTDSVARQFVGARTTTESVTAPTDGVSRQFVGARTVSESISAPTDAVTRQFQASRNVNESITAPTDTVSRIAAFNRAITESITAPTDAVARVTQVLRTINENVTAPTDSVARTANFNRNTVEQLPGPSSGSTNTYIFAIMD